MKKHLVLCLIVAASLSLGSCGLLPGAAKPTGTPQASGSASPTTAASPTSDPAASPSPPPGESAVTQFLAAEPAAAEVGAYLKQNAGGLTPGDADLLLERLVLLQLDISAAMNYKIWDAPYLTALNDTLGGVLDADKIGNIGDAGVRADFQAASEGLMTIVRYEETPVFETDWAALEAVKDAFSDGAAALVLYQSRFQGRYYAGDPYKYDLMAGDIAAVEALIQNTANGFVRWQLKYLYVRQVGRILYGAEGEWLYEFSDGGEEATARIGDFAEAYAGTNFGAICAGMLEVRDEGPEALSAVIADGLRFPPGDPMRLTKEKFDYNGAAVEIPRVSGLTDAAVGEQINASISAFAKALVRSGYDNQSVGYYMSFYNGRYINFCFTHSYRNESDMDHYSEAYLLLDLETGETVTLDALVGAPFADYKDALLGAMKTSAPADLTPPVSFLLDRSELVILVPSEKSDWPDYYPVTFGGLRGFMDISTLY